MLQVWKYLDNDRLFMVLPSYNNNRSEVKQPWCAQNIDFIFSGNSNMAFLFLDVTCTVVCILLYLHSWRCLLIVILSMICNYPVWLSFRTSWSYTSAFFFSFLRSNHTVMLGTPNVFSCLSSRFMFFSSMSDINPRPYICWVLREWTIPGQLASQLFVQILLISNTLLKWL